ncbi:hypothetical protein N3K63_09455 [Microbacterium sp. W1N]|uniref:hypothetical protein n=1 Tax=Microbacterium festucae TaxID=2977531 RepID=UPI0021C14CB9|nr:hypothetical protein [Microbacterium festucae]MCT9820506.1 hypothetical protein [Microbacterium festucae]
MRCVDGALRRIDGRVAAERGAECAVRFERFAVAGDEAGVLAVDRRDEDVVVGLSPDEGRTREQCGGEHGKPLKMSAAERAL